MINIKVNNHEQRVPEGMNLYDILSGIRYIEMPSLYYLKGIIDTDASGVDVVLVNGELVSAIETLAEEGMEIFTRAPEVLEARKAALEKIADIHNKDCVSCPRTGNCELQELLYRYHVRGNDAEYVARKGKVALDDSSPHLVRDMSKCIRCGRCAAVCENVQAVGALNMEGEGLDAIVRAASDEGLGGTNCVHCGQCINVCPVGAIYEKDHTIEVMKAIEDPEKVVIVQVAPAVRAALGEAFEFPIGVDVEGRLAEGLRQLGFDKVFDTRVGADLTILEESAEFIKRWNSGENLPLITSCCPAWINYAERNCHDFLDNISTCKSPHQMFGSIAKTYYAEKMKLDKNNIVMVSIMPCTAKKGEIYRIGLDAAGISDVDYVLTTREVARMMKDKEIDFEALSDQSKFDQPLGTGTGAGIIFGAAGGVMEAALRTAIERISGEPAPRIDLYEVRNHTGCKEATFTVKGRNIRVAVVAGLANAKALLDKIRNKEVAYDFVEVMACPGGCINGGGQPQQLASVKHKLDVCATRAQALYANDVNSTVRKSHENAELNKLYAWYLGTPGSEKAHKLLHTSYEAK